MKIGQRIKYFREANLLTQAELAAKAYTSQQMINQIEHDITTPGLPLAARLAKVFGCTIDDLVSDQQL